MVYTYKVRKPCQQFKKFLSFRFKEKHIIDSMSCLNDVANIHNKSQQYVHLFRIIPPDNHYSCCKVITATYPIWSNIVLQYRFWGSGVCRRSILSWGCRPCPKGRESSWTQWSGGRWIFQRPLFFYLRSAGFCAGSTFFRPDKALSDADRSLSALWMKAGLCGCWMRFLLFLWQ